MHCNCNLIKEMNSVENEKQAETKKNIEQKPKKWQIFDIQSTSGEGAESCVCKEHRTYLILIM